MVNSVNSVKRLFVDALMSNHNYIFGWLLPSGETKIYIQITSFILKSCFP